MAQRHKRTTVNATAMGSIPNWKYLIFSFPRSGNEGKRGVELPAGMVQVELSAGMVCNTRFSLALA